MKPYKYLILIKLMLISLIFLFGCKADEILKITKLNTGSISNITSNSATASGKFNDLSGYVTNYGHCWNTKGNPTNNDLKSTVSGTAQTVDSFYCSLTGLTPNTKYYVRAFAMDGAEYIYGSEISFTTAVAPTITIINPTSAEHWVGNETKLIKWTSTNVTGNVKIDLYKGTTFVTNIGTDIPVIQEEKSWIVPSSAYGKDYKIKITSLANPNIFGEIQAFTLSEVTGTTGTISDVNTNVYKTIKIGKQWWMAENLKSFSYSDLTNMVNGTAVGNIVGNYTTKYYFAYSDDGGNVNIYGRLYTWVAAMNGASSSDSNPSGVRGACPTSWHIPSDAEWKEMELYIGIPEIEIDETGYRGTTQGTTLKKDTILWSGNYPETNAVGFSAIPGGYRNSDGGFLQLTTGANFWTSAQTGDNVYIRRLFNTSQLVSRTTMNRAFGASIRCVRD